ncbi:MAG: AMP-dependent synthetase/ligase [Nitrospinota bacterium]
MDLIELIRQGVERYPDAVALQQDDGRGGLRSFTRREASERSRALAGALRAGGVEKGGRVALLAGNRPEWGMAYFGTLLAGGVLVPLDIRLTPGELENILRRARCGVLLADGEQETALPRLAGALAPPGLFLRLDEAAPWEAPLLAEEARPQPEDTALIVFSSGTTGPPKGVVLTHRNVASNVLAMREVFEAGPADVFLSVLPLNHMFESTAGLLSPWVAGARVHYLHSLNPRTLMEAMVRQRASISLMVPALLRLLHRRIFQEVKARGRVQRALFGALFSLSRAGLRWDLRLGRWFFPAVRRSFGGRLRFLVSGGAPLDLPILRDLTALGLEVIQGYGLTEASPATHCNRPDHNRLGTVGQPLPGVEVEILHREGDNPGEGEVLIRGPGIMAGYFEDPALTAETLREGWLYTGDIGRIDAEGFLTICGRSKNVIVSEAGKNIYPEEVEEELAQSPLIREVCVLGRKVSRAGQMAEEVFAVIVPDGEALAAAGHEGREREALAAEVRARCRNLADYKRVRDFVLWEGDSLPKTTTLKFKRRDIVARLRERPELARAF